MIPALVADEVRETLVDYLRTTWALSDRQLERALFEFLQGRGPDSAGGNSSMFRGPYLRMRLPFAPKPPDATVPLEVHPPYPPYLHQLEAWQRLSSLGGRTPQATLVTTGTGSGKTECFLYPILDHCFRHRDEAGIKAIILYPMNALASDQGRRIAEIIHKDERLSGRLRVGLFVGGDGSNPEMGATTIIDKKEQLRRHPPDILLTNYAMLDRLLLRPVDRPLWEKNEPGTLRYLVLDELHTYDGAQGTDVACLIRRLTARLGGHDDLCPVGTSATVASEAGSSQRELLEFASKIFDQPFDDDALIGETRLSAREFFEGFGDADAEAYPTDAAALEPEPQVEAHQHVSETARHWFPGRQLPRPGAKDFRVALGEATLRLPLARALIRLASERIVALSELDRALVAELPILAQRSEPERQRLVTSVLSLLSWSQRTVGTFNVPLLQVQVQLWVREVRQLMRELSSEPRFYWRDEHPDTERRPGVPTRSGLPMYYCRECGHSGWVTRFSEMGLNREIDFDYARIARAYQARHSDVVYLHCDRNADGDPDNPLTEVWFNPERRTLVAKGEPGWLRLYQHTALSRTAPKKDLQRCPACAAEHGLSFLASRSASLASVAVGHLYTTPLNTDRKLLAFSDSVQDASHRAGFFSGRTYRFSIRSAMLAVVPEQEQLRLSEVAPAMFEYWSEHVSAGETFDAEAAMVAHFLPHDLEFLPEYQQYRDAFLDRAQRQREAQTHGDEDFNEPFPRPTRPLLDALKQRMRWEVTREFGVASRIGRTLERTGCASITLDQNLFDGALSELVTHLPERLGVAQGLGEAAWRQFLIGCVNRARQRGGIFDPLLESYIENNGDGFHLSKQRQPLLSPFGPFTTRPSFLTNIASKRFDNVFPKDRGNWYSDWLERSLGLALPLTEVRDVYAEVMPRLVKVGLFLESSAGQRKVWSLEPSALYVSRRHGWRVCTECALEQPAVVEGPLDPAGQPCPRYRCRGTLQPARDERTARAQSYYQRFYQRKSLGRVWSKEHTGLLERKPREDLEVEFKERPRPDAPNMLSCTPTLEMGIDIGDLSATMLCSVPPNTANYLQRIGRAGRSTGNALILTFASTRPHDLYFYEDPEAVMAGAIRPPGCYLDAPEVLKRQALAYCFDRWAATGHTLPGRVRELLSKGQGDEQFPGPLLRFIDQNRESLQAGFFELFGRGAVRAASKAKLQSFFAGSGPGTSPLEQSLVREVDRARDRRDELRALARRAADQRKKLETDEVTQKKTENWQEELRELRAEQGHLAKELQSHLDADLWSWLCEESLLPNYAFPEAGVRLRAFVRKEGAAIEQAESRSNELTWVRAPSSAIQELAPFNYFYGSGHKVLIDNVEIPRDGAPPWQFCASCHYMERVAELSEGSECPACHAPGWGERGRQRGLLRMTQVRAFTRERDAVVSDESEDRQRTYYETHNFFDVTGAQPRNAWANESVGFGFEMLPSVKLRQINFGERDPMASDSTLGGRKVPDVEFRVCGDCGQVHPGDQRLKRLRRPSHRAACTSKGKPESKQNWQRLHLLRELESEGVRLILPVSTLEPERRIPNVRAAMRLGLKRLYGGDPEFLGVDSYDEPLSASEMNARRRYLLIQDLVPGGTGLLAELTEDKGAKLKQALELAYDAIAKCDCTRRQPAVRACYRCLYAYREQGSLHLIDRTVALEVLEDMLKGFEALAVPEGGTLGALPMSSLLESELEQWFYSVLCNLSEREADVTVERLEHEQLRLTVGGRRWRFEPQVTLGEDVVLRECRPDFVFYPEGQEPEVRAVAGFADGATYHVRPGEKRGRIHDDFAKRQGIASSQRFVSWSFGWDDVQGYLEQDTLAPWVEHAAIATGVSNVARALGLGFGEQAFKNPIQALLAYLRQPLRWEQLAGAFAGAVLVSHGKQVPEHQADKLLDQLSSHLDPSLATHIAVPESKWLVGVTAFGAEPRALLLFAAAKDSLSQLHAHPQKVRGVLRLDDRADTRKSPQFQNTWRQFLRAYNLLQFLPGLSVVTTEQLQPATDGSVRPQVPREEVVLHAAEQRAGAAVWLEHIDELTDEALRPLVAEAARSGFSQFQIPYEVMGHYGSEGQIEVGWPAQKVGIYFDHERHLAQRLEADGWTLFQAEARLELERLLAALKGGRD